MARKLKAIKAKKREAIKKGDTFEGVTDISIVDHHGDGELNDLLFEHHVEVNGGEKGCVTATILWENLPPAVLAAFTEAIDSEQVDEGAMAFNRMKDVVKMWRKQIKALLRINDVGMKFAEEELGE